MSRVFYQHISGDLRKRSLPAVWMGRRGVNGYEGKKSGTDRPVPSRGTGGLAVGPQYVQDVIARCGIDDIILNVFFFDDGHYI